MSTLTRRAWYFGLSSGFSIVSTFVTLPLATRILGPSDYGGYALVTSYAAIVTLVATSGLSYVLAPALPDVRGGDRQALVSTLFASALVIAAVVAGLGLLVLLLVRHHFSELDAVSPGGLAYALGTVTLGAPWMVVTDVLTIDRRAATYAWLLILNTGVGAAATLLALYPGHQGATSLFIGGFAGTASLFAAMTVVIRHDLRPTIRRTWLGAVLRTAPSVLASNLTESARSIVERTLVSASVGLGGLGVFAHAQSYRAYSIEAVNPISRSLYPVGLEEARDPGSSYATTRNAWAVAQLMVIAVGVVFAFLGEQVVAALTHGKFDGAGDLVVAWMVVLLLQMSGKPQTLTLIGLGEGARLARITLVSLLVGIAALVLGLHWFGLVGAVLGQGVQFLVLRVLAGRSAARLRPVPFQDHWVGIGIAVILAAHLADRALSPSTPVAVALAALTLAAIAGSARSVLEAPARRVLALLPAGAGRPASPARPEADALHVDPTEAGPPHHA